MVLVQCRQSNESSTTTFAATFMVCINPLPRMLFTAQAIAFIVCVWECFGARMGTQALVFRCSKRVPFADQAP